MNQLSYRSAGLDLDVYEEAMARLPSVMEKTHSPRVIPNPGGFAGLFAMGNHRRFKNRFRDPVLVTGTDGVGTKLKVAAAAKIYNTVGIDLVAMSVNDCLCLGAAPLFFLDYLALPKDDPDLIEQVVRGVAEGCRQSKAALLGGETAIMPDLYAAGDFDLAGFCVSAVERDEVIDGKRIRPKDVVIGVASNGFHSNGYSLVRKAVFDVAKLKLGSRIAELNGTVAEVLLQPTCIYVAAILDVIKQFGKDRSITGLAHITGGGIADNLVRIFPKSACVTVDRSAWETPAVFQWLQKLGNIDREEMFRVFNMGIGFTVVVRPDVADKVRKRLAKHGLSSWVLGTVKRGEQAVTYAN